MKDVNQHEFVKALAAFLKKLVFCIIFYGNLLGEIII